MARQAAQQCGAGRQPARATYRWHTLRAAVGLAMACAASGSLAQLSVSSAGTATYSLPLVLPPGIAGVVPSLALVHDGRNVNGPVGHGWSLKGTSAITRCHGIPDIDGTMRSVANAGDDKLCLDGQRLIQTSADGAVAAFPQAADSLGLASGMREYRTEKDTFARIRAYGAAGGNPANGPAYFKVWTKNGQVFEYGNHQNTSANAAIVPVGQAVVATWLVSRISDLRGNFIDFQYEQREVAWGSTVPTGLLPLPAGREITVQEVRYTGTAVQAPSNKVVFVYEERPAAAPAGQAHDRSEVFVLGARNVSVRRLAKVQTYINAAATPVKVKTYKLSYDNGPRSNRSRLRQVSECAGPAEQPCLPATRFEYAPGADVAYQANAAFRSSPLAGLVMHSTPPPLSYGGATPPVKYGVLTGDFNGDARTDVLRWSENPAQNQLYFSDGDGAFRLATAFNITDQAFFRHDGCYSARVADFDADGLPDILRYRDSTGFWPGATSFHACPAGATEIYFGKGDGSFVRKPVTGVTLSNATSIITHGDPPPGEPAGDKIGWSVGSTYYLLDVDGDGRLDIVTAVLPSQGNIDPPEPDNPCWTTCTRVFLGDGQGAFREIATNVANKTLYSRPEGSYALGQPSHLNDIDGDGLMDITAAGAFGQEVGHDHPRVWRNRGNGNFEEAAYGSKGDGHPIDYNGDGRSDLLAPASASGGTLYVADGTGKIARVAHNIGVALMTRTLGADPKYTSNIVIGDLDGDSRQDVLHWNDDVSKNTVYLSNGDGSFREAAGFNLKTADHTLQNSAGTNGIVLGDFTGRGRTEILRLAATPGAGGAQSNQLYVPTGSALPADQLVAVVSAAGLRTDITWVPLSNPASGTPGLRYHSDRGDAANPGNAATYPQYDTVSPTQVVATLTADSGVPGQRLITEYGYRGLKSSHGGRGGLGFREVRRQQTGADGTSLLTTATTHQQKHPYEGAVATSETWRGPLNQAGPAVLGRTRNIHCDKTATADALAAADVATPCPTGAKVQRPYVYKTVREGKDLTGTDLPVVTTTSAFNDSGDPTEVTVTTSGSVGGISQVFTQTTSHQYHPDIITGEHWIIGRAQQVRVHNTVPNILASLPAGAGTAPNATATAGSGPIQAGTVSAITFGNVTVGASSTLSATVRSHGLVPLSLTAPSTASVAGADFSFVSSTCPASLAVGATCSVSVKFSPTSAVARTGSLALASGAGSLTAALSGTGIGGISQASLTNGAGQVFGTVSAGAAAPQRTWTFRNDGTGPLSLALSALNAPFSLVSNACTNVAAGGTCALAVQMATSTPGTYSQSGIAISGAGQGNRADLSLSGVVIALTAVTASPSPLAFDTVNKGATKNLTLTVSNTGAGTATGLAYAFANPSGAVVQGSYAFAPGVAGWGTCPAAGGSLAAGASCTLIVQYAASCTGGTNNGDLTLSGANFTAAVTRLTAATRSTGSCQ
jgi:hypothetical protein